MVKQSSRELDAYLDSLARAMRIASIDRQLNARDGAPSRGPMVLSPYAHTIAELGLFQLRQPTPQS
jgi:hypothetical protein